MRFSSFVNLGLLFSVIPPAHAAFVDIQGNVHADAVLYVESQGIVEGYADGTYKPNATINRAEFTKIIVEATYDDEKIAACQANAQLVLSDVLSGAWYAKYVCIAQNEGVIGGYPDGTFQPANTINYAESAKILVKAYGLATVETNGPWYEQYINALVAAKADLSLASDALITRGQMAQLIYNLEFEGEMAAEMEEEKNDDMSENDEGQYTAYNESLVANGRPVVLFFHAAWCHYCQANNDLLLKLYSENSYKVSVLKIDYDTAADLKAKYGVVQQDTFVALDAEGNVQTTVSMPAEGKLEALLTGDY